MSKLEKCIKKEISEFELVEIIEGRLLEPNYFTQEYTEACYDCDGYNINCPLYETETIIKYDPIFRRYKHKND